ncbi:ThiF family adenylyltransferase [Corynebacterium choanae]|uniref:Putative adenylyltransferase/sulfurtransferase MoeZ n=1 Tax=Corynebacterium choanae TaxID=1862358 RepID=A0A3G6J655_9CORY|nr:ThiF family adenylyltransferase [Corynebacterium choanae]AZA13419.1 putative adenylyltransferase/sulfurtransferase MoeZ [Corynebacterium choanae]
MSQRYIRQELLPGFGVAGQQALAQAHVVVIGAGGLGSPVLMYLAAAGVGRLTVIDDDVVDETNLQRQIIHHDDSVGLSKVASAKASIAKINPHCEVRIVNARFTFPEGMQWTEDADVIVDGSDNTDTRYVVSAIAARRQIPHVWAAILGYEAQLSVFRFGQVIYEDVFAQPPLPGDVPSCSQAGVLGPVVGIIGSAMALETIKLITGIGTPLIGKLAVFSSLDHTWETIPLCGDPSRHQQVATQPPRSSAGIPEVFDIDNCAALIDVRNSEEFTHHHLPGAIHVPLASIEHDPAAASANIPDGSVLYCAHGIRSQRAGVLLTLAGVQQLRSLAGGIHRYTQSENQ